MISRSLVWKIYAGFLITVGLVAFGVVLDVSRKSGAESQGVVSHAAGAATVLTVLAGVMGAYWAWRLNTVINQIRTGAERFASGDLGHQIEVPESEELGGLAHSLNRMALQINEKMQRITEQGQEQQAVLASMVEAVLAIDRDERIISMNHAAADLLDINPDEAIGRRIQEVIRNAQVHRFVSRTLASSVTVEGDIILPMEEGEKYLQAHGTVWRDEGGTSLGAIVVIHDVTRLKKLENVRRDFVANVSHELKTPITSIKGFVETLRDGGVTDPSEQEHFLGIIARQADRLHSIIEDLLRLSRIEQDGDRGQIELATHKVREVLEMAVADCVARAAERNAQVNLACPAEITARINGQLIEQAVVNLLDNAIKYSDVSKPVCLEAHVEQGVLTIQVKDQGCGIPAEHLPRIFERFYRVDKARSRKQGGTGLGLAIVKHIAQAHKGSVGVQSVMGKGSVFTIRVPAEPSGV
jgi:two-component system, OmpR family, phosphate regulon sensor histidine kinase PhoR